VSVGLIALLDDVAVLARTAAASVDDIGVAAGRAGTKAAGVIIDDAAVAPQYVQGLAAKRELPIIARIAKGSLRNKLLFIIPVLLLLSEFLPVVLTPILMLGGLYLSYEGAHKVYEKLSGHGAKAVGDEPVDEDTVVKGAVRTDFILSAEIMVISLNEVTDEPFLSRAIILVVVALGITLLIYGVVALLVRADDLGLSLAQRPGAAVASFGRGLVRAMPKVFAGITAVGTAAMLWVGGHILLVGVRDLGWTSPYKALSRIKESVGDATGALGGFLGWTVDTLLSAVVGLVVGAVVVAVVMVVQRARSSRSAPAA